MWKHRDGISCNARESCNDPWEINLLRSLQWTIKTRPLTPPHTYVSLSLLLYSWGAPNPISSICLGPVSPVGSGHTQGLARVCSILSSHAHSVKSMWSWASHCNICLASVLSFFWKLFLRSAPKTQLGKAESKTVSEAGGCSSLYMLWLPTASEQF